MKMIIPTKINIPYYNQPLFTRNRLHSQLDNGLNYAITLITAPTGYGKTATLSKWATLQKHPVAWISLDERDNQFLTFWLLCFAAIEKSNPTFKTENILAYYYTAKTDAFLSTLINELHKISNEFIIVLDDFHVINNEQIINDFAYVIQNAPPKLHLYIASRKARQLPLTKLITEGKVFELTTEDFRFTKEETKQYIYKRFGRKATAYEAEQLQQRTEGWVVGL